MPRGPTLHPRFFTALAITSSICSVTGLPAPVQSEPPHALTLASPGRIGNSAAAMIAQADEAVASRDFDRADGLYRRAWLDAEQRHRAAASLTSLHKIPGFKLSPDDAAIRAALTQLGRGFTRHDTPHFVILSDCESKWTQARADVLERTRAQFYRVADRLALDAMPHRTKLICILFNDHAAYYAFAAARDGLKSPWIAGYYSPTANRVVFYNDSSGPAYAAAREKLDQYRQQVKDTRDRAGRAERDGDASLAQRLAASADDLESQIKQEDKRLLTMATDASTAKTIHEAIHLLAFNSGAQLADRDYPFWFSEGFATSFETEQPAAAFGPDRSASHARRERYQQLRAKGKARPLSDLVAITDLASCDSECADALYCQSNALFTTLYAKDPPAMGRYIRALADQPPGRLTTAQHQALFMSSFGDPAAIERRMAASP